MSILAEDQPTNDPSTPAAPLTDLAHWLQEHSLWILVLAVALTFAGIIGALINRTSDTYKWRMFSGMASVAVVGLLILADQFSFGSLLLFGFLGWIVMTSLRGIALTNIGAAYGLAVMIAFGLLMWLFVAWVQTGDAGLAAPAKVCTGMLLGASVDYTLRGGRRGWPWPFTLARGAGTADNVTPMRRDRWSA